jgi:hypothetical protein
VRDEPRITRELGAWIGAQVLGPVAAALAGVAPATVRVVLPRDAVWLAFRPLELAHARRRWATGSACSACSACP